MTLCYTMMFCSSENNNTNNNNNNKKLQPFICVLLYSFVNLLTIRFDSIRLGQQHHHHRLYHRPHYKHYTKKHTKCANTK